MLRRILAAMGLVLLLPGFLAADVGSKQASPHRRKGGEAFPPLPLPATPLRRTEKKRPPAPPTLILRLRYGTPRQMMHEGERISFQDWNTDPACLQILLRRAQSKLGIEYKDEAKNFTEIPTDPAESPILFITGHQAFDVPSGALERMRAFIALGGTLWCDACCGAKEFTDSCVALGAALFPDQPMRRLPPDHPVFRSFTSIEKVRFTPPVGRPEDVPVLLGTDLGCRTAIFLSPYDLSCGWEGHTHDGARGLQPEDATALGLNVLAYALAYGKIGRFLSLNKVYVDQEKPTAGDFVFGQVKWAGNCDPDPSGPVNLLKEVAARSSAAVKFKRAFVALTSQDLFEYPFLYLTGHEELVLSDAEVERLRSYLKGGGFLLADSCCGRDAFAVSFEREMKRVLPDAECKALAPEHPLLSALNEIRGVSYTTAVRPDASGPATPVFRGIEIEGSLRVLFSPFDLGCGWEGVEHPWAKGLLPADALRVGVNAVVYAMTH
jgi:hypothetical protein